MPSLFEFLKVSFLPSSFQSFVKCPYLFSFFHFVSAYSSIASCLSLLLLFFLFSADVASFFFSVSLLLRLLLLLLLLYRCPSSFLIFSSFLFLFGLVLQSFVRRSALAVSYPTALGRLSALSDGSRQFLSADRRPSNVCSTSSLYGGHLYGLSDWLSGIVVCRQTLCVWLSAVCLTVAARRLPIAIPAGH